MLLQRTTVSATMPIILRLLLLAQLLGSISRTSMTFAAVDDASGAPTRVQISLPTYPPTSALPTTPATTAAVRRSNAVARIDEANERKDKRATAAQSGVAKPIAAASSTTTTQPLLRLRSTAAPKPPGRSAPAAPSVGRTSTTPTTGSTAVQSIPSAKSLSTAAGTSKNSLQPDGPVRSVQGTAPGDAYECPKDEYFQLFPTRCARHSECKPRNGDEFRCCKQIGGRRCVKAVARPLPEPKHEPILGVIPRKCPREPLAELFWDLQTCETDRDCWPRVCCPDGARKYCRTGQPELEKSTLSVARQLSSPVESISRYIQCTPPPPAVFDQFPKKCNSTLDCFPNVCCQEAGRKHCRPPRRSLLSLLTGFASRFNTGIIQQWTQNIVIR